MSEGSPNPQNPQELIITQLVHRRLEKENCLRTGDRGTIAYRIAELMVAAKALYTETLPRLTGEAGEGITFYEELAGLRMTLLYLRDLVTDFDNAFLDAHEHQREAEGVGPFAVQGYVDDDDVYALEDEEEEEPPPTPPFA